MFKRFNANFITALCTGCAIIAFAFFQAHVNVSATTLDVAAATIGLLPAAFGTGLAEELPKQDLGRALT